MSTEFRPIGPEQDAAMANIVREALKYGNISGSICVQTKGAIASIPTRAQIEACIREDEA